MKKWLAIFPFLEPQ